MHGVYKLTMFSEGRFFHQGSSFPGPGSPGLIHMQILISSGALCSLSCCRFPSEDMCPSLQVLLFPLCLIFSRVPSWGAGAQPASSCKKQAQHPQESPLSSSLCLLLSFQKRKKVNKILSSSGFSLWVSSLRELRAIEAKSRAAFL